MSLKCFITFALLAALVNGDVLVDYTERSLEQLLNWVMENVDDNFTMDADLTFSTRDSFMAYELKEWNVTASGMKGLRLLENLGITGSLYSGDLTINLKTSVDLKLEGKYNASYGTLFPFVEDITFDSLGMWSADATVILTQAYYATMNASMDGSLKLVSQYEMEYAPQTTISNVNFDNFLEDHVEQWYYPIVNEGFRGHLQERARLSFRYDHVDVLGGFFEKLFGDINYFDIIERQSGERR